jgi:hypothetical protein
MLMSAHTPKSELEHYAAREIKRLEESEELAWGLIANAYGGDWDKASPVWKEAAERWRDRYHSNLPAIPGDAERPVKTEVAAQ